MFNVTIKPAEHINKQLNYLNQNSIKLFHNNRETSEFIKTETIHDSLIGIYNIKITVGLLVKVCDTVLLAFNNFYFFTELTPYTPVRIELYRVIHSYPH